MTFAQGAGGIGDIEQGCIQRADVVFQTQQVRLLKAFAAVEQQAAGRAIGVDLQVLQRRDGFGRGRLGKAGQHYEYQQ